MMKPLADGVTGRWMVWDAQNRMVSCTLNGTTSSFTYGADGLRRRMTVGNDTTDYLLDGQDVVREMKNGVVEAQYLNGPRGPEYKRDAQGNVEWYVYDGLGSVVATVNDSGTVRTERAYDVYGAVRAGGGGTRHQFVGSLGHASDDETGLIYMRARYMDPATGRFVSEDPAGHGENWFAYVENDPIYFTDPTGESVAIAFEVEYDAAVVGAGMAALASVLIVIGAYSAGMELAAEGISIDVGSLVRLAKGGKQNLRTNDKDIEGLGLDTMSPDEVRKTHKKLRNTNKALADKVKQWQKVHKQRHKG